MAKRMKIGMSDSGAGGLWILKNVRDLLPEYDYVYYGDTLHAPYGNKNKEELLSYTKSILEFMYKERDCYMVILACNTTSASIYEDLKLWVSDNFPDRKIFGIVRPTILALTKDTPQVFFATVRTIESGMYQDAFPSKENSFIALPALASCIEDGIDTDGYMHTIASKYKLNSNIQTGVLCCTHYGLALDSFKKNFPQVKTWIRQEEIIPKHLKEYLDTHKDVVEILSKNSTIEIHNSLPNPTFTAWQRKWFS